MNTSNIYKVVILGAVGSLLFASPAEAQSPAPPPGGGSSTAELEDALTRLDPSQVKANSPRGDLDILLKHWDDPRSEQRLEQLSNAGPRDYGEGVKTFYGYAYVALLKVQATKQCHSFLQGKETPKEKLEAIRQVYATNPPKKSSDLHRMLIQTAAEVGGAEAMDLVVPMGVVLGEVCDYVKKYPEEAVAYARRIGPESLSYRGFSCGLTSIGNADVVALFQDWLLEDAEGKYVGGLVEAFARMPGAKQRLLELLHDSRPAVVREAAGWLRQWFSDRESQDAVRALIERRKQAGAPQDEISYYEAVVGQIGARMAEKKGQP